MKNKKTIQKKNKFKFIKKDIETLENKSLKIGLFLKVLLTGVCFFLLILLIFLAKFYPYFTFDLNVTLFIQHFKSTYLINLMNFVSLFGYGWFKYVILGLFVGFLYLKKLAKEAGLLAFSTLGADLISNILKVVISRPRPDPRLIFQLGQFTKPDGFPSGHVVFYIGFFGFLIYIIFKLMQNRKIKTLAILFCLFFIVLVGPSRIYLGAHWLSDVIGGYFLGFLWLALSINIYNYLKSKNEN